MNSAILFRPHWFLGPGNLAVWEIVFLPNRNIGYWFSTCTAYWRILPQPYKIYHLAGTVTESLKDHSIILSNQPLQDGGGMIRPVEFYKHGPIAELHLLRSEFLEQEAILCWIPWWWMRPFLSHFGRVLYARMSNLCLEYVSILGSKTLHLP